MEMDRSKEKVEESTRHKWLRTTTLFGICPKYSDKSQISRSTLFAQAYLSYYLGLLRSDTHLNRLVETHFEMQSYS